MASEREGLSGCCLASCDRRVLLLDGSTFVSTTSRCRIKARREHYHWSSELRLGSRTGVITAGEFAASGGMLDTAADLSTMCAIQSYSADAWRAWTSDVATGVECRGVGTLSGGGPGCTPGIDLRKSRNVGLVRSPS